MDNSNYLYLNTSILYVYYTPEKIKQKMDITFLFYPFL